MNWPGKANRSGGMRFITAPTNTSTRCELLLTLVKHSPLGQHGSMPIDSRIIETDVIVADNRTLHVRESGDPTGLPVLFHHGTPMAGLLAPWWIDDAEARSLRLVAYDRPGYGLSTPHPGRTVGDAAADACAIADALGIDRFATWGLSGGGPHAIACAALAPDRVIAAASGSGVAPFGIEELDFLAGMGEDNIAEFGAAIEGRSSVEPMVKAWAQEMIAADAQSVMAAVESLVSDVDKAELSGELAEFLHASTQIGLGSGVDGWVDDDLAFVKPWGFDLAEIKVPVSIWQGAQDLMVPFSHGRWLAENISGAESKLIEEYGHFTIPGSKISELHSWLLDTSNR
jgi:pimeloyl-ACP methyl ester carboxylesterase